MAALRADMARHEEVESEDPLADLDAALGRIAGAMPNGLGRLIAACLSQPDSELDEWRGTPKSCRWPTASPPAWRR